MLKNSHILSLKNFVHAFAPLMVAGQSISSSISLVMAIINAERLAGQLLGQAKLVGAQTLHIHEPT